MYRIYLPENNFIKNKLNINRFYFSYYFITFLFYNERDAPF